MVDIGGLSNVTSCNDFRLFDCDALTDLSPLARLAGEKLLADRVVLLIENPVLPTCDAERLRDQIGQANIGTVSIADNDDSGVCL